MLKQFFAITVSGSLYEVSTEVNDRGWPTAKRIVDGAGNTADFRLRNGRLVGIGGIKNGICLFDPDSKYGRAFECINTRLWGGSTSSLVALFLRQSTAEECLASGDHAMLSERYRDETRAVLGEIGDNHPVFVVGESMKKLL